MKSLIVSLIAFSLFAGSFGFVEAQTTTGQTCECWCGVEGRGADMKGNNFINTDQCRAKCDAVDETFLSCSFKGDRTSPHTNLRCWNTKECNESGGVPSDETPAECLPGFAHCFAQDEPVKLSVALGEFGFVQGIGGYINAFYQWILGAAALFAVIMMMVGAIQYMMSGGSSSGVGEAKKRIFGALIGLVILLGAYVMLNTVNPQLLSLRLPAIPKVRSVMTPAASNSCESYAVQDYRVKPGSGACGQEGVVEKGPDGESIEEKECTYRECAQPSDAGVDGVAVQCMVHTEDASQTGCKPCEAFTNDENAYPKADGSVCGSFRYLVVGNQHKDCLYFPEKTNLAQEAVQAATGGNNEYSFCGKVEFTCGGSVKTCKDYGDIVIKTSDIDLNVLQLTLSKVANAEPTITEALLPSPIDVVRLAARAGLSNPAPFQQMCSDDPCELHCRFEDTGGDFLAWSDNRYQCVSTASSP